MLLMGSLVAQMGKNPPVMRMTWVRSLGWEDPLEKGNATHSSILAWRIPWTVWSMGFKESDTTDRLSLHFIRAEKSQMSEQSWYLQTPVSKHNCPWTVCEESGAGESQSSGHECLYHVSHCIVTGHSSSPKWQIDSKYIGFNNKEWICSIFCSENKFLKELFGYASGFKL